jgi:regulator of replication initiation timing
MSRYKEAETNLSQQLRTTEQDQEKAVQAKSQLIDDFTRLKLDYEILAAKMKRQTEEAETNAQQRTKFYS